MGRSLSAALVSLGLSGGSRPWLPTHDMDVLIWDRSQASDNGAALTVPEKNGGPALSASGSGRFVITSDALDVGVSGFVASEATQPLKASLGSFLTGKSDITLLVTARNLTTASGGGYGRIAQVGAEKAYIQFAIQSPSPYPNVQIVRATTSTQSATTKNQIEPLSYPRVLCLRFTAGSSVKLYSDGDSLTLDVSGGAASGAFSGDLVIGMKDVSGTYTLPFKGAFGSVALARRALSDSEIRILSDLLASYDGQTGARNLTLIGDSRFSCNNALQAQWVKAADDLYQEAGGVRYLRLVGHIHGSAGVTWDRDYTWSVSGVSSENWDSLYGAANHPEWWPTDVIVICLGINDIQGLGRTAPQAAASLRTLLTTVASYWPGKRIDVWDTPYGPTNEAAATLASLNALYPGVVADAVSAGIPCTHWDGLQAISSEPSITWEGGDGKHYAGDATTTTRLAEVAEARFRAICT